MAMYVLYPASREGRNDNWLTQRDVGQMTPISMLPDEVLLEIFDFCADEVQSTKKQIEAWHSLAHVCRQWRRIVFGSSRRLNLRLLCTPGTPTRNTLDVWPALPLLIWGEDFASGMDDIVAVLASRSSHVCQIKLAGLQSSQLKEVSAAMQEPFPELTHLELWSYDETAPVLPNSFSGGSIPSLRFLWLARIPFPGLPKLLLSATHLVDVHLWGIPHSGYVPPDVIVIALSTLTNLESLSLKFQSPRSRPEYRPSHSLPRSALPVLKYFWFKGVSEYLNYLVEGIDAPQLEYLDICFFNQLIFNTPSVLQFISRTPTLNKPEKAHLSFESGAARVDLSSQTPGHGELIVEISCMESDWQLSSLEQVCTSSLPRSRFSKLEDLCIFERPSLQPDWHDNIESRQWLELLHPFIHVKNLYLSEVFASRIVPALIEEPIQRPIKLEMTYVLPALQNVFLEGFQPSGPMQKAIGQFIAAREATGRTIAVSRWNKRSRL